jgi:ATP-binding cassette subfamily F protein uup
MAELRELRRQRREARRAVGTAKLTVTDAEDSGKLVIEAVGVTKAWAGVAVVADVSMRIARGDRVGIVGPNGAGKTTLMNLLTGAIPPDRGTVRLGANLAMVTLDQRRESLDPNATVADTLTGGGSDFVEVAGERKHVVGYMRDFLFPPEQARTPVSVLSGGERGRLMLARALAKPSNLLVLDEPTNDLDLETLDLLEEMIGDYAGTVIVISHDRDFLDRVATSVVMAEGGGRWVEYAGGYSDMLAQRGTGVERRAAAAAAPTSPAAGAKAAGRPVPATGVRRKLTFKEKHALQTLPGRIDSLSAEAQALGAALADGSFYARDPKGFAQTSQRLAEIEAAKAAAEEEWLTLEMLREELEG